jgi:hypothetical protein
MQAALSLSTGLDWYVSFIPVMNYHVSLESFVSFCGMEQTWVQHFVPEGARDFVVRSYL